MNTTTENTNATETKKKAGRPAKLVFPTTGRFKVSDLVKQSGITPAGVHARLKKMILEGVAFEVQKDSNVRGRKAGIYSLDKNEISVNPISE